MSENLLPKGGGVDQPSLDHRVFLHFLITLEKANVPKYIFNHMLWALKESQNSNMSWIPYGRLLFEIFHQGGILKAIKLSKIIIDAQLGTVTSKVMNGCTLRKMLLIKKEEYTQLSTNLLESSVVSNLMDDFPPFCRQDPPDVRAHYVYEHWKRTGETIKFDEIPKTMYGGALPIARKRKSKKKATSEADDDEEAFEPKKKTKKAKDAPQEQSVGSEVPTIHDEVQDLELVKILDKRTRSGKTVGSSQSLPPQPSIPRKKVKQNVRKLKVSTYVREEDEEIEAASDLITREVKKKKAADAAASQKALKIAKDFAVPAEALLKESTIEAAHKVIELTKDLQQLVVASDLLNAAEETQKEDATCSELDASEAARGNTDSHNISNVIEVESSSTSASHYNSVSTSSDIDNIPLNRVYANLHKSLSPSSSTKNQKKPVDDAFVPMYPSVLNRIIDMSQMRIDVCARLPANHPMQPPMIEPLQTIPVDVEGGSEQVVPGPNIPETSSSQPQPSTQTSDPSVLDELPNHYQGELPGFEPNLENATEIASDEVTLESTSTTLTTAEPTSMLTLCEPSSSNSTQLTDITFPPILLLDSIILKEVCENMFKDLNKLVKTRNNLVHEDDYVSEWTSLRSRVDYMMCELQKLSLETHDKALLDLQQWFQGVTVNLEKVELNRSLERRRLYLSDTHMYLDASSIILSNVHSKNPDFT